MILYEPILVNVGKTSINDYPEIVKFLTKNEDTKKRKDNTYGKNTASNKK